MNTHYGAFALAIVAGSLAAAQPVSGQSFLLPSTPEKGLWIETEHTSFKDFETSIPSTVWYLSGRYPVTSQLRVVADVPFSYARISEVGAGSESSSVFGNPRLGLEFLATRNLMVEVDTRLPLNTADQESFADVIAFIANPLRPEAFLDDLVPVSAAATYQQALPSGLGFRARGGVTSLFFTGDDSSDNETAVDYGLVGTYQRGIGQLALGFTGRWYASNDEGTFNENSLHQAAISADVGIAGIRPGVMVRVPLDKDYRDVVNSAVGFYVQVALP